MAIVLALGCLGLATHSADVRFSVAEKTVGEEGSAVKNTPLGTFRVPDKVRVDFSLFSASVRILIFLFCIVLTVFSDGRVGYPLPTLPSRSVSIRILIFCFVLC